MGSVSVSRSRNNLIGQVFGRLTVLREEEKDRHGNFRWTVSCECGEEKTVLGGNLLSRTKTSCGCHFSEVVSKRNQKPRSNPRGGFNKTLRAYICSARKRDLEFKLTTEQFRHLTSSNCVYCGQTPSTVKTIYAPDKAPITSSQYVCNGIDRVDNAKGYVLDNCVPCCPTCNFAKRKMSLIEFKTWIMALCETHMRSNNAS